MKFVLIIILVCSYNALKLVDNKEVVSFNSYITLNNNNSENNNTSISSSDLRFKAKIYITKEGLKIVPLEEILNIQEKNIKIIADKEEDESYIVDYRLFRSCENTNTKSTKSTTTLQYSPFSLENRTTNTNFLINLTLINNTNGQTATLNNPNNPNISYSSLIHNLCLSRKSIFKRIKSKFSKSVILYKQVKSELNNTITKLRIKEKELDKLNSSNLDIDNQIGDIKTLEKSFAQQLKFIDMLRKGTKRLVISEKEKIINLNTEYKALELDAKKLEKEIINKENTMNSYKFEFSKLIDSNKTNENEYINLQKALSDYENKISEINLNSLKNKYEIESKIKEKSNNTNIISNIKEEISKITKEIVDNNNNTNNTNTEKTNLNNQVNNTKDVIKSLEEKINQLIIEKSHKEEHLKGLYDEIRNKEDYITTYTLNSERLRINKNSLIIRKEQLEGNNNITLNSKLSKLTKIKALLIKKYSYFNSKLNTNKVILERIANKKNTITKSINSNKNNVDKLETNLYSIKRNLSNNEANLNEISNKIKDRENKLQSLTNESVDYTEEIENITKSLKISKENYNTYIGLSDEFKEKINPIHKKLESIKINKKELENKAKIVINIIKKEAMRIKNEAPSSTIMIDMAEEDALNSVSSVGGIGVSSDSGIINKNNPIINVNNNAKWRRLINKVVE